MPEILWQHVTFR